MPPRVGSLRRPGKRLERLGAFLSDSVIGGYGNRAPPLQSPYVNMIRLDLSFGDGAHGGLGINEKAVSQRNRVR